MREHWTLDQYVEELMALARMEFEGAVHPDLIIRKSRVLQSEMQERFTPEQLMVHGIFFEKSV